MEPSEIELLSNREARALKARLQHDMTAANIPEETQNIIREAYDRGVNDAWTAIIRVSKIADDIIT